MVSTPTQAAHAHRTRVKSVYVDAANENGWLRVCEEEREREGEGERERERERMMWTVEWELLHRRAEVVV